MDTTIQYGANQHFGLHQQDLMTSLKDYLDVALYKNIKKGLHIPSPDKEISSNKDLWNFIIRNEGYPNQVVKFLNFYLLEWIPTAPGLYFTDQADYIRHEVDSHVRKETKYVANQRFDEYNPDEKFSMIRGGYGSLRLGSRLIQDEDKYILGLSSNAISHEGIPVLINQTHYLKIVNNLKENGLICVNLIGTLKLLPLGNFGIKFKYSSDVPKYCIEAEDIEIEKNKITNPQVSVAIIYSNQNVDWGSRYGHSFCTFKPDAGDKNLRLAVEWLSDYAVRYSGNTEPKIIGDFDEYFDHFPSVNFPISQIVNGHISIEELTKVFNSVNIPFETVHNKILFLTSNPYKMSRVRTDKEAEGIEEALKRAKKRDSFDFVKKLATTREGLSRAILDEKPQILHFSGHGKTEGIVLENEKGYATTAPTEGISDLLSLFHDTIKCVFLNSCYSESQAQEISKHIPYVVGMSNAIPDKTAIAFAISFYDAIGAGEDFEFAFKFGKANINLKGLPGHEIPVLLRR